MGGLPYSFISRRTSLRSCAGLSCDTRTNPIVAPIRGEHSFYRTFIKVSHIPRCTAIAEVARRPRNRIPSRSQSPSSLFRLPRQTFHPAQPCVAIGRKFSIGIVEGTNFAFEQQAEKHGVKTVGVNFAVSRKEPDPIPNRPVLYWMPLPILLRVKAHFVLKANGPESQPSAVAH